MQSDLDQFVSGTLASDSKILWLVLYETNYYDPHDALLTRLRHLGQVTEVRFPPEQDAPASEEDPPPRLIRISVK
jgi:hypothetical protein